MILRVNNQIFNLDHMVHLYICRSEEEYHVEMKCMLCGDVETFTLAVYQSAEEAQRFVDSVYRAMQRGDRYLWCNGNLGGCERP